MRYLENLSKSELKTIVTYNNDLRNMLEEKYIEDTMYYVEDILDVIGGKKWDIGFYQYNYWYSARTRKSMEAIIKATESYGLCSEEEIEKVKYCIELMNRLDDMDYRNNKQYDNLETKVENLLDEIDDMITINFNGLTDDSYIDNDLLLEELYCTLDCEDETYYVLDDLDTVYKDDIKEFC